MHNYLGLSRQCRVIEAKQACYAATGAVQMGVAYVASGVSPGAKVLVIATGVALVDARAQYTEPARHLAGRGELTFDEYEGLLKETLGCLVPQKDRDIEIGRWSAVLDRRSVPRPLLALKAVRNYHREYEWG